jgi:hypothetical protein
MSLDLAVVAESWAMILVTVVSYIVLKSLGIYAVARLFRATHAEALERTALMAQGGEFAFVLYGAALAVGLIDARGSSTLTAIIILSMILTPLLVALHGRLRRRDAPGGGEGMEGPQDLHNAVLLIGFGRFGQIVSQVLLSRGWSVSMIDTDTEMITVAGYMGMKVYFGDGARLDILHAAGAGEARAVLVCIDQPEAATRIVEVVKAEFPLVPVLARAYDRAHCAGIGARRCGLPDARDLRVGADLRRPRAGRPGRGARGGGRGDREVRKRGCRPPWRADVRRHQLGGASLAVVEPPRGAARGGAAGGTPGARRGAVGGERAVVRGAGLDPPPPQVVLARLLDLHGHEVAGLQPLPALVDEQVAVDLGRVALGAAGGAVLVHLVHQHLHPAAHLGGELRLGDACALSMKRSQRSCLTSGATWSGSAFDRAPCTSSYWKQPTRSSCASSSQSSSVWNSASVSPG